jgi:hypothetical protein
MRSEEVTEEDCDGRCCAIIVVMCPIMVAGKVTRTIGGVVKTSRGGYE